MKGLLIVLGGTLGCYFFVFFLRAGVRITVFERTWTRTRSRSRTTTSTRTRIRKIWSDTR